MSAGAMTPDEKAFFTKMRETFRGIIRGYKAYLAEQDMPTDWETFADSDDWFFLRKRLEYRTLRQFFELCWREMDLDEYFAPEVKS